MDVIYALNMTGYDRLYKPYEYSLAGFSKRWGKLTHTFPGTDTLSFCGYHFCLYRHNSEASGWRVVGLIDDPLNNKAGGVAQFEVARRALEICTLGDFRTERVDQAWLETIVGLIKSQIDDYAYIETKGHKDFDQTICPASIYDEIPKIREYLCRSIRNDN
jgi:hypothetical protein